ncbi:MAG: hypothetical protein AAB474_01165 [Patescibacteria group bacterium]
MLNYFLILFLGGFAGLLIMVSRRIYIIRSLNFEEQKQKMETLPSFFDFLRQNIGRPLGDFSQKQIHPALLKLGEKFLRRFRLLVLKIETGLHRLSDYFRGKRIAIKNGESGGNGKNSEFWDEMHKTKNGLQNGGSEKTEK